MEYRARAVPLDQHCTNKMNSTQMQDQTSVSHRAEGEIAPCMHQRQAARSLRRRGRAGAVK